MYSSLFGLYSSTPNSLASLSHFKYLWIVYAGIPVVDISFLAALPVGARSANFSGFKLIISNNSLTIHLIIVVFPVPGPPVIIVKLLFRALVIAFLCDSS